MTTSISDWKAVSIEMVQRQRDDEPADLVRQNDFGLRVELDEVEKRGHDRIPIWEKTDENKKRVGGRTFLIIIK